MTEKAREFDLEDRLVDYASSIIELTESLPNTRAGNHVASHYCGPARRRRRITARRRRRNQEGILCTKWGYA